MSLWVDKHRPTALSKLDYHKEQAAHMKKLVCTRTCSSVIVTVTHPRSPLDLKFEITYRSLTHYAPVLWNALPKELRQPFVHSFKANQFDSCTDPLLALSNLTLNSYLPTIISINFNLFGWLLRAPI